MTFAISNADINFEYLALRQLRGGEWERELFAEVGDGMKG
jgi:hypothetical protein